MSVAAVVGKTERRNREFAGLLRHQLISHLRAGSADAVDKARALSAARRNYIETRNRTYARQAKSLRAPRPEFLRKRDDKTQCLAKPNFVAVYFGLDLHGKALRQPKRHQQSENDQQFSSAHRTHLLFPVPIDHAE